ncbi:MAG: phosphoenolpyruvate--protein phosphotransferase [Lachnospiraceae bacterium]|nr:phosphoenolpyruvate--protein phosphotransferase [Lachnospiraceae bacterium]
MIELSGIPVYKSIEIAPVFLYREADIVIERSKINEEEIQGELKRFEDIHSKALQELAQLKDQAVEKRQLEEVEIFDAHLMMADDPMMTGKIKNRIQQEFYSLEQSVEETKKEIMDLFLNMQNDYFRARSADVEDVANRFLRIALGIESNRIDIIQEDVILAARDLKPSEASQINQFIKGILLEEGSQTSHVAIMAKAKGIPTIVGITGLLGQLEEGEQVILDSIGNHIYLSPDETILSEYQTRQIQLIAKRKKMEAVRNEEAITKDGRVIKLYGNIGNAEEAELVTSSGGKGIGLFRTEFLYMNSRHFPTEEEQFNEYKKTAQQGLEDVIIRTLDIGGDKNLPYYEFQHEENPFLGFRALRFTLANKELFRVQLRAILRASAFGKVSIMFPMVSSLDEVLQAKELLEECKKELDEKQINYDKAIRTGIMIEIPSAAIIADILAQEVDFFSIGTNDLCQYTLAVDRMNKEVAYLYQPLHPAILRLIRQTADAAHAAGKEIGICGEMAGEATNVIALIGLGVDELSMSPAVIPEIKTLIRQINYEDTKEIAKKIVACRTAEEITLILKEEESKYDY